jgi:membrane protein DedA with SNARE-associated domain
VSTAAQAPVAAWQYALLFLGVVLSWAGVPGIGTLAMGTAGVLASQGQLDLAVAVAVATIGGEVGGAIGYQVGDRWGRSLLERPGKHREGRRRMVDKAEVAYRRWGWLAVFFTPSVVSGAAKMGFGRFLAWNLVDALVVSVSVVASAYGIGRLATGHHDTEDVVALLVGLAATVLAVVATVRRRRRRAHGDAPPVTGGS